MVVSFGPVPEHDVFPARIDGETVRRIRAFIMNNRRCAAVLTVILVFVARFRADAQSGGLSGETQRPDVSSAHGASRSLTFPLATKGAFNRPHDRGLGLAAAEPLIASPILAQFDPDGRLWVVEVPSYMPNPQALGETQPTGRVSILEDTDGDGRMDKKTVFLDGLVLPRAFLLVHGGALVCEPPNLWFHPMQGDKPGPRQLVADDFAKEADPKLGDLMNPEHAGSSLLLGMDNWVYALYHPYRYRRVAGKWTREPTPQRVQWGLSQDDFGRLFYTSNSDQLRGDVIPGHYFGSQVGRHPGIGVAIATDQSVWPSHPTPGVNRGYEPGTLRPNGTLAKFTAACGTLIYRGDLMPEFQGNAFVCEPAANVVRRNLLSEKDGVVTAMNAHGQAEFLESTDEVFRPVNLTTGPDGAIYVVDMAHGIIQHRVYLTPYLRAQAESRGLQNVTNLGRIWRIGPTNLTQAGSRKPALSRASTVELVAALSHPNGWWRDTAQRLLVERGDPLAVPALENLVRTSTNALARLHGLWTLEGVGLLSSSVIELSLADINPKIRAAGVRLAESVDLGSGAHAGLRGTLLRLVADPAADVRVQLALSLAFCLSRSNAWPEAVAALTALGADTVPLVQDVAKHVLAAPKGARDLAATSGVAAAGTPSKGGRPLTPAEKKRLADGRVMFEATCLACHQQHGMGQPGLAPPLVGSEWVAGSPARLIRIVLHGLRGPIKVKGETYELDMPALGVLDDEQIAAALTYVRREWGHEFDPVDPEMVKKVRDETAARDDAWTQAELLRIP